jgi:hypothetical protein
MRCGKPRLTVDETGFALVGLLFRTIQESEQRDAEFVDKLVAEYSADAQQKYQEIQYLRAFATVFGVVMTLNRSTLDAIVTSYTGWLERAAKDMLKEGVVNGLVFYENYCSRVPVYDEAIRNGETTGLGLLKLGGAFCTYCGCEKNLAIASRAMVKFSATQKWSKSGCDLSKSSSKASQVFGLAGQYRPEASLR